MSKGDDLADDRARAERVAAQRRQRRQWTNLAIRLVSLAIALGLWELAARNVDPVLFTSPTKVAFAAWSMVLSGELWTYLWPSLVVLAIGFALAVLAGIAVWVLPARLRPLALPPHCYIPLLPFIPAVS